MPSVAPHCLLATVQAPPHGLGWPLLTSLRASLTVPLANSPEASCVLSLSFKDLYVAFFLPEKLFSLLV